MADANKTDDLAPAPKKSKALPIAFLLCFLLSLGTSSGVTFFLTSKKPPEVTPQASKRDKPQDEKLLELQALVTSQQQTIEQLEQEAELLKIYLRHSSADAIKHILIDQERNIQAFIKVLKEAMNEHAKFTPREKKWNEDFQVQLNLALKGSLEREDLLKLLKTGEPTAPQ
ncbi:hypothetical protein [Marinomonas epiphytica]